MRFPCSLSFGLNISAKDSVKPYYNFNCSFVVYCSALYVSSNTIYKIVINNWVLEKSFNSDFSWLLTDSLKFIKSLLFVGL